MGAEALRLPGEQRGALRRARGEPCHERHGTVRVPPLQAPRRPRRSPRLLRRRAFVMENGAKGCEVTISGKMGQQRAKVMKFKDGYLISTGQPKDLFVEECSRNVLLRQGVMGIKVKILKPHDPEGKQGPKMPMPDYVVVHSRRRTP